MKRLAIVSLLVILCGCSPSTAKQTNIAAKSASLGVGPTIGAVTQPSNCIEVVGVDGVFTIDRRNDSVTEIPRFHPVARPFAYHTVVVIETNGTVTVLGKPVTIEELPGGCVKVSAK
jgi:hypothetical protein